MFAGDIQVAQAFRDAAAWMYNRPHGEDGTCAMMQQAFRYCPYCGTPLEIRERFQRLRPVCPACGFVYFCDPKVAVIAMITWENHVLLVRRGVEPELGKWALPGGYMDADEMPEAALARELAEEVGIAVELDKLLEIFPMAGPNQRNRGIVLVYAGRPAARDLAPLDSRDDVWEAEWFRADALPDNLAFESTVSLLRQWQVAFEG